MRYIDELQCAAGRIVQAMREYALKTTGSPEFDTMHIRRGDFQYEETRIEASVIYENIRHIVPNKTVIYVATDEHDKHFFTDLGQHYDLKFMDDFMPQLEGVNHNYFGMIDQRTFLVCVCEHKF